LFQTGNVTQIENTHDENHSTVVVQFKGVMPDLDQTTEQTATIACFLVPQEICCNSHHGLREGTRRMRRRPQYKERKKGGEKERGREQEGRR
jgi:hypothetical protein